METKSRVILYQEYREEIAHMEDYSFHESNPVGQHAQKEEGETSLSASLDELMEKEEIRNQEEEIKNTKKLYREKKKEERKKSGIPKFLFVLIPLCVLLLAGLAVLIVFLMKGGA